MILSHEIFIKTHCYNFFKYFNLRSGFVITFTKITIFEDWKFLYSKEFDKANIPEINSELCEYYRNESDSRN